jgi:hypothetical protein
VQDKLDVSDSSIKHWFYAPSQKIGAKALILDVIKQLKVALLSLSFKQ